MIKSPSSLTNCSLCMEENLRQELCGVFFEMYPVSVPALPFPQGVSSMEFSRLEIWPPWSFAS